MLAGHPAIFGNAWANARSDLYIGTCTTPSTSGSNPRRKGTVHRHNASRTWPIRSRISGRSPAPNMAECHDHSRLPPNATPYAGPPAADQPDPSAKANRCTRPDRSGSIRAADGGSQFDASERHGSSPLPVSEKGGTGHGRSHPGKQIPSGILTRGKRRPLRKFLNVNIRENGLIPN